MPSTPSGLPISPPKLCTNPCTAFSQGIDQKMKIDEQIIVPTIMTPHNNMIAESQIDGLSRFRNTFEGT